jgi:antitoxin (DNA-binding transcriptional repressor) of toxin-antitoxin stability system
VSSIAHARATRSRSREQTGSAVRPRSSAAVSAPPTVWMIFKESSPNAKQLPTLTRLSTGRNLIIRYCDDMRTMTATEASRNFSALLDAIERGETITITRGHHAVAEMRPARVRTGADLRAALDRIPPPDDRFAADIASALAMIFSEGDDPWAGA